ncbi:MAG: amino acid adenylation domain-containing protein [Pseudomonadota bacterium]
MKYTEDFLLELGKLDIKVWAENDRIRCKAPKGVLTTELRAELTERKTELLQFLHKKEIFEQAIPPLSEGEALPISLAQHRLWFLYQLEGQSTAYNIPAALRLSGQLNETALQRSLTTLIQRHDSLRLCFSVTDGEATVELNEVYNPLSVTDLSELSETEQQAQVRECISNHIQTLFDLSSGPLLSLHLLKLGEKEHILLFNMHHIISDGWSMDVLIRDWGLLYNAYAQNQEPKLPKLPIQYIDYAAWQRNWLQGEVLEQQVAYWSNKLAGAPELLELPTDYPRPAVMQHQGKHLHSTLNQELTQGIKQLSQQHGVTIFMTLLAAFNVLLFRYSGQNDLVVGTPIANRTHHQTEGLVGLFMNTLVLRTQIKGEQTFPELLKQVKRTALEAYNHQDIPFEYLVDKLNPSRSLSHSPLYQVLFVLQDDVPEEVLELSRLKISFLEVDEMTAKVDLTLSVTEYSSGEFVCVWKYKTDLFCSETITRMAEHFRILLEGILNNQEQSLSQLPLLTSTEQQQLQTWNQTETDYPFEQTLVDLFQAQVEKTPNNIAVVFEGQTLSYQVLNTKANQLAHYLMTLEVGAETLVGICVERSLEMVIGLLGILKAGGAYVPFDPDYPQERLQFMLEDSEVKVLLSQSHLLSILPVSTAKMVCLDSEWEQIATSSDKNPVRQSEPEDLAYVIYTSGSTGKPKGAMNLHQAICNRLLWMQDAYHLTGADNVLQKTPFSFDVSVWEFFWPLLAGARLTVAKPGGHKESNYLIKLIEQEEITTLHFVPSMLQVFLQDPTLKNCHSLKRVICSGEALPVELQARFFAALPTVELHNLYGPTEAAVDVSYWACQPNTSLNIVPIGRPIANIQIYILDANHNPTPLGIPGELCIAGKGLARGYIGNRPELTSEKFIETEVFGKIQRLYKTGDLARWLPDGNLEYLGRLDYQIKLRGFRIELGEIEAALGQHEAVKEAVVVLYNKDDNPRLISYVTLAMQVDDVMEVLRTWLQTRLPEYMLPTSFTVLEQLPLTSNGKIDRKALPEPEAVQTGLIAPQTWAEQLIADIWQNLLGIDGIGIHDDFFAIGGNSLNGMRFINELNYKTGDVFHIYTLFEAPTVAMFVDYMKIHYPQLMAKMDDSYSLPEMSQYDSLEKVNAAELVQFRQLLPELHFNNTINAGKNPPAIFILAPPRSGTTLFRVILGGHPHLFAPPEMELLGFNNLKERHTRCMERDSFWLQGTIRALMEINNCDVESAKQLMNSYEQQDLDVKQFYKVLQTAIGDKLLVDKTPFYAVDVNILQQAEEYFDNAVYIHLLRHPYGMIHSFEKARLEQIVATHPYAFPLNALAGSSSSTKLAELLWLQCHQNILEFLQTIPASRQYALKFEDLVNHPQPTIENLCDFLERPFDPNMLQPYQNKKRSMTDGLYVDGNMLGDIKFHTHQQIDAKVAEGWKNTYRVDFLGDITWTLAEQFGYQRELRLINIPRIPEDKPLTISFAQQRLWLLAELEGQSATYNMPVASHLEGQLNETALQRSLTTLIERHDSLRLCFPAVGGEATIQRGDVYNPLSITDLSDLSATEQQESVTKWIANHAQTQFELSTGPLLSVRLLKLSEQEQILLFNMHHIISDGWSMGVLIRDWSQLYNAYAQNQEPQLPKLPIRYTDYAAWQKDRLVGEVLEQQLAYWKEKLTGVPELLELPTDYPRPAVMRYQGKRWQSTLNQKIMQGIMQLSQQHGVTVFMTLLAAFKVLLFRYSGQTDLVVGSPTANRAHYQTEALVGFFVNTLVLRTQIKGEQTFSELLKEVRQTALDAYSRQDIPFEYLVEQINPARSLSHSPLFQVMFVLQNTPEEVPELSGLKTSFLEPEHTTAKFDLTLNIAKNGDVFVCDWEYDTDLFRPETISRMSEHFLILLEGILNNPEQSLPQLPLLTEAEQQQLLAWNQTETDYPKNQTIVDLFQAQVEKTPNNIAVVFEGQALSYQVLNTKANQLAHYLMTLEVGAETLVGICVERSLEMMIGLLGILKAGGAYVPLDPDYPQQRLQFMLENSKLKVLLSQSHLLERLPVSTAKVVCLDSEWEQIAAGSGENLLKQSGPENLAYVIYTSGSTGTPKGVMVGHSALVNFLSYMQQRVELTSTDKLLALTTLSFDIAALELYLPLITGSQTIIISREMATNGEILVQKLAEEQITIMQATPATWKLLLQSGWHQLTPLTILSGGEALPRQLGQTLLKNSRQLWNVYGPTETTIWSSIHDVTQYPQKPELIGQPIANTKITILDVNHNPTPLGIPGELCIAGAGLAKGYLNRPELTAEKFIEIDVFGKLQRLYKTGDLARWLPDGNLEYLGRFDHQVKLRGFRIELSEIEVTLSQHEAVKEAVVVLYNKKEDNPRLIAYVTLVIKTDEVSGVLRTWLKTRLPEYMLPASFTVLDKLPLTPNGKIDRKALPAPDALATNKHYQTPRDTFELQLTQIWENVLEVSPIGINDNFFELGGHSLLAVKLMSQIHQTFDQHLPIATLFQGATIAELAAIIRHHDTTWPTLIPIQPQGRSKPLFCLPGAGGNVIYLHSLATNLGKDQPCYGLQPPGLDGKSITPDTIEVLATNHINELQKVQPQGPYYIAGHSFGGKVAFELARQLEQRGETVALLVILDTRPSTSDGKDDTTTWNETDWLWAIVGIFEQLTETEYGLSKEMLQSQETLEQSYELVMQHLKQQGIFFAPTAESEQLKAMVNTYKANIHAHANYQPQCRLKAPIVLFRAQEQPEDTISVLSEDLDWGQYTSEKVTVEWTPGTHLTMFKEPHVKQLAAKWLHYLDS